MVRGKAILVLVFLWRRKFGDGHDGYRQQLLGGVSTEDPRFLCPSTYLPS